MPVITVTHVSGSYPVAAGVLILAAIVKVHCLIQWASRSQITPQRDWLKCALTPIQPDLNGISSYSCTITIEIHLSTIRIIRATLQTSLNQKRYGCRSGVIARSYILLLHHHCCRAGYCVALTVIRNFPSTFVIYRHRGAYRGARG